MNKHHGPIDEIRPFDPERRWDPMVFTKHVWRRALSAVPAFGHDGEDHEASAETYADRCAEDGSIIPEPDPEPEAKDAIDSRAELAALEKELDQEGSPAAYVCADGGGGRSS